MVASVEVHKCNYVNAGTEWTVCPLFSAFTYNNESQDHTLLPGQNKSTWHNIYQRNGAK